MKEVKRPGPGHPVRSIVLAVTGLLVSAIGSGAAREGAAGGRPVACETPSDPTLHGYLIGDSRSDNPTATKCEPNALPHSFVMRGDIAPLGNSVLHATSCMVTSNFAFPFLFASLESGRATLTVENGDLIFAELTGRVRSDISCLAAAQSRSGEFTLDLTVTGGTGRFRGLSGEFSALGTTVSALCPPGSIPHPGYWAASLAGQLSVPPVHPSNPSNPSNQETSQP